MGNKHSKFKRPGCRSLPSGANLRPPPKPFASSSPTPSVSVSTSPDIPQTETDNSSCEAIPPIMSRNQLPPEEPSYEPQRPTSSSPLNTPVVSTSSCKAAETPKDPCPLFRLPRELRLQIYSYVLVSNSAICWPARKKAVPFSTSTSASTTSTTTASNSTTTPSAPKQPSLSPALLRVSRAIHQEAASFLYSSNTFTFPHPSDANMFRVISSPVFGAHVSRIQLAIRERDVSLWTGYLGSNHPERSMLRDFPHLRALRVAFPSSFWSPLRGELSESYFRWQNDPRLREICLSLEKFEPGVVKVVCAHALPAQNVRELVNSYPSELWADDVGVVRLRTTVRLFNATVGLELIPIGAV